MLLEKNPLSVMELNGYDIIGKIGKIIEKYRI
jgi:hypothetical protein